VHKLISYSGNGLVSYYINIVLDGVGITSAAAKVCSRVIFRVWPLTNILREQSMATFRSESMKIVHICQLTYYRPDF
jgi:hypothetical protein